MMVSEYNDDFYVIALQIDHSRVAGYLAANWGNDTFIRLEPYLSMVVAAQEHDNGWWSWELRPTIDEVGRPYDYIGSVRHLGSGVWCDLARAGVARLIELDPYAGLVAQMHAEGLLTQGKGLLPHMPDQTDVPGVREFLEEGAQLRRRLKDEMAAMADYAPYVVDDVVWRNYKYLQVFDQLGQYLCNRYPLDNRTRTTGPKETLGNTPVPVRDGVDDIKLVVRPLDERRAELDPYPFDADPLRVAFPARLLPRRRYRDQPDLLEAFYRAERIGVSYELTAA
jgi:hypothetical protein